MGFVGLKKADEGLIVGYLRSLSNAPGVLAGLWSL